MRECGSAIALPLGSAGQQNRGHRSGLTHAIGHDVRFHQPHRVENRKTRGNRAAGRIDVQRNILLRILGGQEQHLGDDQVRDVVVDRRAQENNVFLEKARINVESALAARSLFDHHGHQDGILHDKTLLNRL